MKRIIYASDSARLGKFSKFYRFATDEDFENLGYTEEDRELPDANCIAWVIAKTPELEEQMGEYSLGCLYKTANGEPGVKVPYGRRGMMAIKPALLEDLFDDTVTSSTSIKVIRASKEAKSKRNQTFN